MSQISVGYRPRLDRSGGLLLALLLAGCGSAISQTDEACAHSRATVDVFVECLRGHYATLTGGLSGQGDLGALYLAAAEYQAAQVAEGRETNATAMLELADFRMRVLAPMEQQRRDRDFQNVMKAIQSASNSDQQSAQPKGYQSSQSASGQRRSRY